MKNSKVDLRARTALAGAGLVAMAFIAPTGALAQQADGAAENHGIGEIIVTAQKREQSLQAVPVAITAVSGEVLATNRIQSVFDLSGIAPGVIARPSAGGSSLPSITIRGARTQASMPGSEKQIGIYIDGVYLGATSGSVFDLPSIQRIEVLRGPQGTLFGQSATGGAISIITPDPKGELGGKQTVTVGNYAQFRSRTQLDLPAVGPLTASLVYEHAERRGDVRNLGAGTTWSFVNSPASGISPQTSPKWLGDQNSETIQGAVKLAPNDDMSLTYKVFSVSTDSTPEANGSTAIDLPSIRTVFNSFSPGSGNFVAGLLTGAPTYPKRPDAVNNWFTMPSHFYNEGHILTGQAHLSDAISIKDTLGHLKGHFTVPGNQIDGLGGIQVAPGLPFVAIVNSTYGRYKEWSNEFQVNIDTKLVSATAGYLHYILDQTSGGPANVKNTTSFGVIPGFTLPFSALAQNKNTNKSDALYAQAEVHVTDQLDVIGGVRWTHDHKTGFADYPSLPKSFVYSDSRWTYSLGANYRITPDILVYGKYSTAYVSGGSFVGEAWKPETAKSWEAGIKSDLLDRRLRANLAVYSVKYTDLQVTALGFLQAALTGRPELAAVSQLMFNAGDARARGFELELTAAPIEGLTLSGSTGYTDFKYTRTDPIRLAPIAFARPLLRPKWTATVSAQYETQPVVGDATLVFRVDGNFVSSYETVSDSRETPPLAGRGHIPSTWLWNGRIALTKLDIGGGKVDIAAWGRNLSNNRNQAYAFNGGALAPLNMATYQRARTFGVDLTVAF